MYMMVRTPGPLEVRALRLLTTQYIARKNYVHNSSHSPKILNGSLTKIVPGTYFSQVPTRDFVRVAL